MDEARQELAEVLGQDGVTVEMRGGVRVRLCPLTLNQLCQIEAAVEGLNTFQRIRRRAHWSAMNGGYTGTEDEFGDLVTEQNIRSLSRAVRELSGRDDENEGDEAGGVDPTGAETGPDGSGPSPEPQDGPTDRSES